MMCCVSVSCLGEKQSEGFFSFPSHAVKAVVFPLTQIKHAVVSSR